MEELLKTLTEPIPTWKLVIIDKWTDFKVWLWCKVYGVGKG